MDKAELSEIRARLREAAERESRPRRPLLAPFRPRGAVAPTPPASYPTARRVGLNPTTVIDDGVLLLAEPLDSGRNAFGQRTEAAAESLPPLLLPAPEPDPILADEVPPEPRRRVLLAPRPAAAPAETPYHPEDLSDPTEAEAERLYAAAGLAPAPERPRLRIIREAAPPPDPERELLAHLERVFLAEQAGLEALRL